ncbi:MAG TPA: glutamate-cysteine ligase family protein, partial [Pseudonocardiaceae bacterium]
MPAELHDRAAAEAYVASVCFKHGPPRRLGVELEWIVCHAHDPGGALDAAQLADALGDHAPRSIRPDSPHHELPAGSTVTVEPGGQVEISTPPCRSLSELLAVATGDTEALTRRLEQAGLRLLHSGTDPVRAPSRLVRSPRYDAMHDHYHREGPSGHLMMCSTAAQQVALDVGTAGQAGLRWAALHATGPVLAAVFANSAVLGGGATGHASTRLHLWSGIGRAAHPPVDLTGRTHPGAGYARHALDLPLLCVRRGDDWHAPPDRTFADWVAGALPTRPTTDDLDYHLTTLFPPVRPCGRYLEVRYLDAQPAGRWALPVAVLAALLADDATTAAAL